MKQQYKLKDGRIAFVRSGIGKNAFKAFSKKPNPEKEDGYDTPHGIPSLPWMGTPEMAQEYLDDAVKEQKGIFKGAVSYNDEEPEEEMKNKDKKETVANTVTDLKDEGMLEEMNPDDLTVLSELQTRVTMNEEAILDYCNLIRTGMAYRFPPLEAVKDNESGAFLLYDGFHRLEAYKRVAEEGDYQSVMVRWKPGTMEDALWYAIAANQEHGIRRTNEDKRNAVLKALEHPRGKLMSDRALADWVGVSAPTVASLRNSTVKVLQLEHGEKSNINCKTFTVDQETRIGKDGKRRKLPTRTSTEPSFSTPPEPVKKPSTPEDWFMKPVKEPSKKEVEKLRTGLQERINGIYDYLSENGLITEYDHLEDANLTLYKGSIFIGTFCVPFLPPHKMPEPE